MVRHIPKRLLIHTVSHKYTRTLDAFQKETFSGTRTIKYVRMDPSSSIVISKENQQIKLTSLLFYDCLNSSPRDVVFILDEVIVWNGQDFRIKVIDQIVDDHGTHHFELGLI